MHYVADYYLKSSWTGRPAPASVTLALQGSLSLALYLLLFEFDETLVEMELLTRQGDKEFFPVPIALAFLFSWIHGSFAGRFWDMLGFRPRSG